MVEPIKEVVVNLNEGVAEKKEERSGLEMIEGAVPVTAEEAPVEEAPVAAAPVVEEVVDEGPSQAEIDAMVAEHLNKVAPEIKPFLPEVKATPGKSYKELKAEGKDEEAMERLVEEKGAILAQQILTQIFQTDAQFSNAQKTREANKTVYSKYPELITAEKTWESVKNSKSTAEFFKEQPPIVKAMSDAYQANPQLRTLPNGGVIAMAIAEQNLAAQGVVPVTRKKVKKVETKVEETVVTPPDTSTEDRVQRARAAAVVARPVSGGVALPAKASELSAEDRAAMDFMGLSEAEWVKYKKNTPIFDENYYKKYRGIARPKGGAR